MSPLTGELNETERSLAEFEFLADESVRFNQTFCERLELSELEGAVSVHGLSSACLRDIEGDGEFQLKLWCVLRHSELMTFDSWLVTGPMAAVYTHLASVSESGALPDIDDHILKLPPLMKEDVAMAADGGGVFLTSC